MTLVMKKLAPTDQSPTNEPNNTHPTPLEPAAEPLATSADSKKAWAKKTATKQPISFMLLIRVTGGDQKLLRSLLWSVCRNRIARLTTEGGRNPRAVVTVKLREIKEPQFAYVWNAEKRWRLRDQGSLPGEPLRELESRKSW